MIKGETMQNRQMESTDRSTPKIQPMPLWESTLYFIVITLLMILCFYLVRPFLESLGLNEYTAYLLSLSIVGIVMLVWTFFALLFEGNLKNWKTFLSRIRLNRITPGLVGWSVGLGFLMFLSTLIFSPLISRLISNGLVPTPNHIPDYINPVMQMSVTQIKAQLISQRVVFLIPFVLILNIFGEEFFWRGLVFPRQELRHGKHTFIVHGLIWAFTHLFQYWLILPILIGSFALAYLVQRTKNTWIGILAHLINNVLPFIIMLFIPA
jgi:membrane protease YdiL (CAAX protease family)